MTIEQNRVRKGVREGGQYSPTQHGEATGVSLTPRTAGDVLLQSASVRELFEAEYRRLAGDAAIEHKYPEGKSEVRRMLATKRGEKDGKVRFVHLNSSNSPYTGHDEYIDVSAPTDGRPIVVDLSSGQPHLKVTAGTAIIRAESRWGNSITVADEAKAIVIASGDSKVHVAVEPGGHAVCVSDDETNRIHINLHDGGSAETAYGYGAERTEFVPEDIDPDYFAPIQTPVADVEVEEEDDDEEEDDYDEDICSCGASLDDGEGYDGMCGNCTDRAEAGLFHSDVTDADGDELGFTVHKDEDDDQYRVVDEDGDTVLSFDYLGDEEAHDEIQSAMIRAFKEQKGIDLFDEEHALQAR